jgi:hypothetical protein
MYAFAQTLHTPAPILSLMSRKLFKVSEAITYILGTIPHDK